MNEHQIQNAILRVYGSDPRLRLWRQNVGAAVVGDVGKIMTVCRRLGINARVVAFGVPGQADLTGIMPGGIRLEVEVKSATGRASTEQTAYGTMIGRLGGVYVLARSVEDVGAALAGKLEGR